MTIVESIKCVLQQNNDGLTSKQINDEIIRQGLYSFGAENPVGVVNAQLRRRCIGLDFPTAYPIKFFEIAGYEGKKIKFRLISTENTATIITAPKTTDISELLPEEKIKAALQEHLQNIRQQVFDSVLNNSPEFFEHLVVDLLLKMGYGYDKNSGIVTGKPHDGGIDGIISEDMFGRTVAEKFKYIFPCFCIFGATLKSDMVWTIQDIALGLLTIPNLIAMVFLWPKVRKATKEFFGTPRT